MNIEFGFNRENLEDEEKFNFEEIAEIEPAVISLTRKLKEKIENAEYDTLISDDVGGRIPTLILRKIIKEVVPDKKIETFFIASGKTYLPAASDYEKEKYNQLQEYLKKATQKTKKALIVTQFIFTGKTLIDLAEALKQSGVENFDIATVDAMPNFEKEKILLKKLGENNLYIGGEDWHQLHEKHEKLGGIKKTKDYSPFPKKAKDVIDKDGRDFSLEEWREIFQIEENDSYDVVNKKVKDPNNEEEYERRARIPLTPEEIADIQKNINSARKDINLLANKVVKEVWGKNN